MYKSTIENERIRRLDLWAQLKERGGTDSVSPSLIRELGIHLGQAGVFRDRRRTRDIAGNHTGIAVGVLHTGSRYADDLFDDGVIYHYPETNRGNRDNNEILAMKACRELELPLFVVVSRRRSSAGRNVRLGWIADYDDIAAQMLIIFSQESPSFGTLPTETADPERFTLQAPRRSGLSISRCRPNQATFRFGVIKRYGEGCAVCDLVYPELLHAAHLCPVEQNGTDDPQNGIVLCLTHHGAFDLNLFCIHPETLDLCMSTRIGEPGSIGIQRKSIRHLPRLPHRDALSWVWSRFERAAVDSRNKVRPIRHQAYSSAEAKPTV